MTEGKVNSDCQKSAIIDNILFIFSEGSCKRKSLKNKITVTLQRLTDIKFKKK